MATIIVDQLGDDAAAQAAGTTLREAVISANNGDTICFDASLAGGTITLTQGQPISVGADITIDGDIVGADDAADITIDLNGVTRFDVSVFSKLTLNSLNVTGNGASFGGFDTNAAVVVAGAFGTALNVHASTFSGNVGGGEQGGAIWSSGADVTITDSTFTGNSALNFGGAIYTEGGTLSLSNVTMVGNETTGLVGQGGAVSTNGGTLNVVNSTITDNTAAGAGGFFLDGTVATLTNTIVSGNTVRFFDPNVFGAFTDGGGNVIDGTVADIFGSNVLADNGGPVQTIALVNSASNPALDVGARTGAAANGQPAVDIPGVDNDADGTEIGDAGAYELLCFAAGTRIATPTGEISVETLQIGDLVRTADGRDVPVKWIGRQTILKRFAGARAQLVRIRAGALGNHSDLYVTVDHGMVLDGYVINAAALVNGYEVDFVPLEDKPDSFTVYHIETEAHDVILANGAASETYLDMPGRRAFDNYQEYIDLNGAEDPIRENPMPRIAAPRLVPSAIRRKVA